MNEIVETNGECPMHDVLTYETIKDAQIEALAIDHMRHFRNLIKRAQSGRSHAVRRFSFCLRHHVGHERTTQAATCF